MRLFVLVFGFQRKRLVLRFLLGFIPVISILFEVGLETLYLFEANRRNQLCSMLVFLMSY